MTFSYDNQYLVVTISSMMYGFFTVLLYSMSLSCCMCVVNWKSTSVS